MAHALSGIHHRNRLARIDLEGNSIGEGGQQALR